MLLRLEQVCKSYGHGRRAVSVLDHISFGVDAGEVVAVWGMRRSGRSTLLRVAAGIERPDSGRVLFEDTDLQGARVADAATGIAYCRRSFAARDGSSVLDQLVSTQEALGIRGREAPTRARATLERTGVPHCASLAVSELAGAETVRVAIARALLAQPQLILIDEPEIGVPMTERDAVLGLLRNVAESGCAVLMTTGETPCLSAADRALSIGAGVLRGELLPGLAEVLPLRAGARPAA
jgi:ABC-type lipoprotein export system ATPase subunit